MKPTQRTTMNLANIAYAGKEDPAAGDSLLAPASYRHVSGESGHVVQFYENDAFLVESVSIFIGDALKNGEGAIVIAIQSHLESLEEHLESQGLDLPATKARGHYLSLDAPTTLSSFMVGDSIDEGLFRNAAEEMIRRMTAGRRGLRAFGEMVALLWSQGNETAAIRLEELWNDLGKTHPFSILCAYPMNDFRGEANCAKFAHICHEHSRVVPAESYAAAGASSEGERLRAVALLQQKAASLETEILERKQAEAELRRSNEDLVSFFENATLGLHCFRQDGIIKWANQMEFRQLGYAREEYVGHHISEFHADKAVASDILARSARGESLKDYETLLRCKDGTLKHTLIDSNVQQEHGRIVHTQCFTRDITDRKRAEQESHDANDKLARSNEELERRVAERTARLQETVGELEAFSYSVSHDIRSPLRAMNSHARALLERYGAQLAPDATVSLERIQRAATRLDLLVRDVLAYSKVSKESLLLGPIALGPLIQDLIHYRPDFEAVKNWITVEEPLHSVLGHEACITQCISNLVDNALKFVAPGTAPHVRIRSELTASKVRLWVSDNGVGIQPEHAGRIFQIFGRVYSEKHYEGTGIGLAIVRKAVARMGGETGFMSEFGKGSDFWLDFSPAN